MALPNCPRCKNFTFELQEVLIRSSTYKHLLINCSACGCVVGNAPYLESSVLINQLTEKVNTLKRDLDSQLIRISQKLNA